MLLGMLLLCALHVPFILAPEQVRSRGARTIIVHAVYLNQRSVVNGKWEQKASGILQIFYMFLSVI
jgi:hypothetical protein